MRRESIYKNINEILKIIKPKEKGITILLRESNENQINKDIVMNNYYHLGNLLAFLYFFNVNKLKKENIFIINKNYVIYNFESFIGTKRYKNKNNSSKEVANLIIANSVVAIDFIEDIKEISNQKIKDLKRGFEDFYKSIVINKSKIIKIISESDLEEYKYEKFEFLIMKVKVSSELDLNRQLKFLDFLLCGRELLDVEENRIKKILFSKNIDKKNLQKIADNLIAKSIVGYYDNEPNITWIESKNNKLVPVDKNLTGKSIEKVMLLLLISVVTKEQYYEAIALELLRTIRLCY